MQTETSRPTSAARAHEITELEHHGRTFVDAIARQGYSAATLGYYRRAVGRLIEQMAAQGLAAADLDAAAIAQLRGIVLERAAKSTRRYSAFCVDRFYRYLVDIGAAPPVPAIVDNSARGRLKRDYEDYLRRQRGLSDATIYHCLRFFERFFTFRFGAGLGELAAITPGDITTFLEQLTDRPQPFRDKTPPTHLRTLFQFLFWSGRISRNLAASIPRVAHRKNARLPRHLTQEQVQMLIDAVRGDAATGRRNYTMLLLIARLGLRAPEVVAIRLDDIDWRRGEILIRGKGKLHDRMPLPPDVGGALVDYIRNTRRGSSRFLFVVSRAPYRPLVDGQIVNMVLRQAFAKTGLTPPPAYVGSHILRHSLAMHMLDEGASLSEIGNVLRHRSLTTTTIYAKHDVGALRALALPWPVRGGMA